MNIQLSILITLLFPVFAGADVCSQGDALALEWRSQKQWKEESVQVPGQPQLAYPTYKSEEGRVFMAPFEIRGDLPVKMTMNITSNYSKKDFVSMCQDDLHDGILLTSARENGSQNQFRVRVDYSPVFSGNSPFKNQGFKTSANGLGVRLVLREGAMVKKNTYFPKDYKQVISDWELKTEKALKAQSDQSQPSSVEVSLDGMDDLACDVLKGRVELEFYHFSDMDSAKVKKTAEVSAEEVQGLYELNRSTATTSKEDNLFAAGAAWKQLQLLLADPTQLTLATPFQALKVSKQFYDTTVTKLLNLSPEEISCLAENESAYKKGRYSNSVVLSLKTQNIYQVGE